MCLFRVLQILIQEEKLHARAFATLLNLGQALITEAPPTKQQPATLLKALGVSRAVAFEDFDSAAPLPSDWITLGMKRAMTQLEDLADIHPAFTRLNDHVVADCDLWFEWISCERPEEETLPTALKVCAVLTASPGYCIASPLLARPVSLFRIGRVFAGGHAV